MNWLTDFLQGYTIGKDLQSLNTKIPALPGADNAAQKGLQNHAKATDPNNWRNTKVGKAITGLAQFMPKSGGEQAAASPADFTPGSADGVIEDTNIYG